MKAYEIYLSGANELQITLCDPQIVKDFLNKNYELYLKKYNLNLDELEEFEDDENVLLQMVPVLRIDDKDCFFTTIREYREFIQSHPEIKIVDNYQGYLY